MPRPNVSYEGNGVDSSAVCAGLARFEFPLHEALPRRHRKPSRMPDLALENRIFRTESGHEQAFLRV